MTSRRSFKLKPALVPVPLWEKSIYRNLPRRKWNSLIRQKIYEKANGKCEICSKSSEKGMACHELWRYSDKHLTAVLKGFMLLCPECNLATHFGLAIRIGEEETALKQIMNVNCITKHDAKKLIDRSFYIHNKRSNIDGWKIIISQKLITEFPFLSSLSL